MHFPLAPVGDYDEPALLRYDPNPTPEVQLGLFKVGCQLR